MEPAGQLQICLPTVGLLTAGSHGCSIWTESVTEVRNFRTLYRSLARKTQFVWTRVVSLAASSDRVAFGRQLDLPVFFGDAGSREVLHKVGADRACAAAVTLDSPGANYRTVWALSKHFPNVKTFVRAHDVDHGLNLEKAGATAVVPETLEPSLQLAAAVLAQAKLPESEITTAINEFRSRHLSELTELCEASGSSLGYGFMRITKKTKSPPVESPDDNQVGEGTLAI